MTGERRVVNDGEKDRTQATHPGRRSAASNFGDGRRVLLIGSSGFLGSAIARDLEARGWPVTYFVHNSPGIPGRDEAIRGDLADLDSLRRACSGHDMVINAASYVGSDSDAQHRVNAAGGANLARAVELTGVSRLLYISSTSVYSGQVPNGSSERSSGFTPRSTLSASRLAAEKATIDVGGVVLRPHLVYGRGDTFFLPPLMKAMGAVGGWIEGGRARVSAISSDALARAAVDVAAAPPSQLKHTIFHAAHPQPVTVKELVEKALEEGGLRGPERSFGIEHARDMLVPRGVSESQIAMVAIDNWVDSRLLWETLAAPPGPQIHMPPETGSWYRSRLAPAS